MPSKGIEGCTGVLVAGGRASRLGGVPKGLVRLGGEPIAARTLRLFAELFPASLVVANVPEYRDLGVPVIPDRIPGKGPPAGVHAALHAVHTEWIFAAACDMPFIEALPIRLLADRRGGAEAVLVRCGGRLHPLHAFWSRASLPALERLISEGNPSLVDLAGVVRTRIVDEAEWRTVDPGGRVLENVNTFEDAARLGLDTHIAPASPLA
ncbi:MAG TPA: molybdenum cofactor guanylyltransferase [Anaeromyxobacter sp.]|nr:molybdenum cofactor guanylyltransferase [Anaeromyxobacter sp.]